MLKKLAAQTAIYGISSIIARFLNYLLTPYLTRIMTTGEYGVVTDLYALIPFILLLLTMGMETGYFHFAGKAGTSEEKRLIFQTTWGIVILVSLLFFGFTLLFLHPLSVVMDYAGTPSYLLLMGSIITVDAVTALPFAKLREENKDIKIASCATGNDNIRMQKILKYYNCHEMSNLKFYYKKV